MDVDFLRTVSGPPVPGIDTLLMKQGYRALANDRSGVVLDVSSAVKLHGGKEPRLTTSKMEPFCACSISTNSRMAIHTGLSSIQDMPHRTPRKLPYARALGCTPEHRQGRGQSCHQ